MSGIAVKLGGYILEGTLKELGKQAGMAALNGLTDDMFNQDKKKQEALEGKIDGVKKDAEEIKRHVEVIDAKLTEVISRLTTTGNEINKLQNNVDDKFFGIKMDKVNEAVIAIDTAHQLYLSAIRSLAPKSLEKSAGFNRDRVRMLGEDVIKPNGVYLHLMNIHAGLIEGSNSLLTQCQAIALRDSKDIVTYYVRVRAIYANYIAVQFRGISLLICAQKDPLVKYSDGEAADALAAISHNMTLQYETFVTMIGPRTESFVRNILERPGEAVMMMFKAAEGDLYLDPRTKEDDGDETIVSYESGRHIRTVDGYVVPDPHLRFWEIRLGHPGEGSIKEIDVKGNYWFYMQPAQKHSERRLVCGPGVVLELYTESLGHQKNWASGEEFQFYPSSNDQLFMNTGNDGVMTTNIYMNDLGKVSFQKKPKQLDNLSGSSNRVLFNGERRAPLHPDLAPYKFYVYSPHEHGVGNTLISGSDSLPAGVHMVSPNRRYRFGISRKTGAIELTDHEKPEHKILWSEDHSGKNVKATPGGGYLAFQGDGNLVAYNNEPKAFWASQTNSNNWDKRSAVLDDTGRLKVFDQNGQALHSWP